MEVFGTITQLQRLEHVYGGAGWATKPELVEAKAVMLARRKARQVLDWTVECDRVPRAAGEGIG
jgi:hypothetical protein